MKGIFSYFLANVSGRMLLKKLLMLLKLHFVRKVYKVCIIILQKIQDMEAEIVGKNSMRLQVQLHHFFEINTAALQN